MNKVLLAALLAGVASSAFAADLPTHKAPPAPAPAYYAPPFSWTGFYIGVNGGGAFGTGSSGDFGNPSGGLVGGTVGYNYQISQFVLGLEGDWDWAGVTKNGTNVDGSYKTRADENLTARARVGYAWNRALLYVTGGYAGVNEKNTLYGYGSQTSWRSGGAIGGGVEYAFTNNISAKVEYLYEPLEDKNFNVGGAGLKSKMDLSVVRAGLNYKF